MSESFSAGGAARSGAVGQGRIAVLDPRLEACSLASRPPGCWTVRSAIPAVNVRPGLPADARGQRARKPRRGGRPDHLVGAFVGHHLAALNALFATIQLALGLGIAWRPTVRLALGASVAWALGVWWFGEGLGGVLAGTASPVNGAPGAVILYAVLAVLLWPAGRDVSAPFVAAGAVGAGIARGLWLAVWGSLAVFALLPAARAPQAISGTISGMASGEPAWLAWVDSRLGASLSHHDLVASVVLAAALAIVAARVFGPARFARPVIVLALVLAVALWLAQGLGGIFTGSGTDPDSGPLLALLALSFWPGGA